VFLLPAVEAQEEDQVKDHYYICASDEFECEILDLFLSLLWSLDLLRQPVINLHEYY